MKHRLPPRARSSSTSENKSALVQTELLTEGKESPASSVTESTPMVNEILSSEKTEASSSSDLSEKNESIPPLVGLATGTEPGRSTPPPLPPVRSSQKPPPLPPGGYAPFPHPDPRPRQAIRRSSRGQWRRHSCPGRRSGRVAGQERRGQNNDFLHDSSAWCRPPLARSILATRMSRACRCTAVRAAASVICPRKNPFSAS